MKSCYRLFARWNFGKILAFHSGNLVRKVSQPARVTREGYFWKFFLINFLTNLVQHIWWPFRVLKTSLFELKNCCDYFLGKIWATLYSNIWSHFRQRTFSASLREIFLSPKNNKMTKDSLMLKDGWKGGSRFRLISTKIAAKLPRKITSREPDCNKGGGKFVIQFRVLFW